MAWTINNGKLYFNTKLYTGNASTQTISGVGFQPDWTWVKVRSEVGSHRLADAVRGNTKYLFSNGTDAEATDSTNITSWNSDGFALGSGSVNESSRTYAAWNWKANGSGSLNEVGSIDSTVSVNTTSGFSIVSYTGTGSAGTVGHGLGVTPKIMIAKSRSGTRNWITYTTVIDGSMDYLYLNLTDAKGNSTASVPTSSIVNLTSGAEVNASSENFIMYCFNDVQGYSKISSYVGNGSTDGTFVYTGFKPAFVIIKRTDSTSSWSMRDTVRSPNNVVTNRLWSDLSNAESTSTTETIDILSNGFKCRNNAAGINASGGSYIYMAFAENPFTSSTGTPVTAR